jgi:hypothetical protein
MRCPNCGADIPLRKVTCPACGTPRPQLPPRFAKLESRYISLQNRYQAGEIDLTTYRAEIQKLVIQDHGGVSWWLGGETGQWHTHDGQEWVPRDPPFANASPLVSTPQPKPASGKRKISWPLIAIPTVLVLICLCVFVLYFTGIFDKASQVVLDILPPTKTAQATEQEPGLVSQTITPTSEPTPITLSLVELSQQQQLLIDEFSWPDSFTILEADDEQGEHVRFETWIYYGGKITFTFFDGVFQVEGDVETLPDGFISTPHHPDQFPLGASPDQIQSLLQDHTLVPIDHSEAIQPGAQMFVAQQLVLGFLDNRLFYVDALAFIPEGSEE